MLISRRQKPDVTEYPLGLVSDRPHPLRDVFHVEPRDPLYVARSEVILVEGQAQRPPLPRRRLTLNSLFYSMDTRDLRSVTRENRRHYLFAIGVEAQYISIGWSR